MRLVLLAVFVFLVLGATAEESKDDNGVGFSDYSLNLGDSISVGDYHIELVDVQSVKDGLTLVRAYKTGGSLDEQRVLLENSANSFDGGSDEGGVTVTVLQIFDEQSVKLRVEYPKSLGTPRKEVSEVSTSKANSIPNLIVEKSFDKYDFSVGDEIKATVKVTNIGTASASGITVNDQPPLPEFLYIAGYPPKIKETIDPGESDSATYYMDAVKEGSIKVPAIEVRYIDNKKNTKSNQSQPFSVTINPRSKPNLILRMSPSGLLPSGGKGLLNVSITNVGKAIAYRVEVKSDVKPADGLDISGLDESYFEIAPGGVESYSADMTGRKSGNYTISLKVSFQSGDEMMLKEASTDVTVLEREYKYLYYLVILPIILIAAWVVKRYREYKY